MEMLGQGLAHLHINQVCVCNRSTCLCQRVLIAVLLRRWALTRLCVQGRLIYNSQGFCCGCSLSQVAADTLSNGYTKGGDWSASSLTGIGVCIISILHAVAACEPGLLPSSMWPFCKLCCSPGMMLS